jgi:1-acyl-sn-glycerol-3-phosphate acyltransferase
MRSEPVYRPIIGLFLTIFRLLRLRISVTGDDHVPARGGAVLAITHFGYLEFALAGAGVWWRRRRLVRFLATKATWGHPIAGPLMRGMHHIPVDRAAGTGAYAAGVAGLRNGELLGVFPEGMVSRSWTLKSFKTGAVRLAHEAQVPLIPVVIWGGHRIITKGRRPSLRRAHRVPVTITYGEPMQPGSDAVAATAQLKQVMEQMVARAQAEYPDQPRGARDRWWLPAHLGGSAPTAAQAQHQDRQAAQR